MEYLASDEFKSAIAEMLRRFGGRDLTDDEIDAQLQIIYDKGIALRGRTDPDGNERRLQCQLDMTPEGDFEWSVWVGRLH